MKCEFEHPYDVTDHYFSGQQKLIVSQPGGGQPRLIVPGQHLTLLTSNGTGSNPNQLNSSMLESKKDGMGFFTGDKFIDLGTQTNQLQ